VDLDLTEESVREKPLPAVIERDAGFVTGGFKAENQPFSGALLERIKEIILPIIFHEVS
jgi:hypothetical protein